jgi:hypothetical protein
MTTTIIIITIIKVQNLFTWDIIAININRSIAATLCTLEK